MWRLYACVSFILLASCGGGGSGGAPAAQSTGIPPSYYPVGIGSHWTYDIRSDGNASYMDDLWVTGKKVVAGENAWVFSEDNPTGDGVATESYYAKDARAFTYVGSSLSTAWLDALISPLELMRFDGSFSASPLLNRRNAPLGVDLDGDALIEHADVLVTGTVAGKETLVTPLGSFSDTARLRYNVSGVIRLSTGATVPFNETIQEWRAPDVGTLRQIVDTEISGSMQSERLDVRGLSVNGIMAGILAPRELLGDLASADSNTTRPGQPALASDGSGYLLVSNRQTPSGVQWLGLLMGSDGQGLKTLDLSLAADRWGPPALAWNGVNYLVVTGAGSSSGMHARRVSPMGDILDAHPGALLATDGYNQAVASGSGRWLAVYARTGLGGSLFGRFVNELGVAGNEFTIATGVSNDSAPAVAYNGQSFVVVWAARQAAGDPSTSDIYATRVSLLGTTLDPAPFPVTTAAEAQWWPQIACGIADCLVAWVDRRNYPGQSYSVSPGPGDLYGALVTQDGSIRNGSIPIALAVTANAGYPALAFAGTDYVALWSSGGFVNNPGGPTGVYGARISTQGLVTSDAGGFAVSAPPEAATRYVYPVLAASRTGVLAAWLSNAEQAGSVKTIAGTVIWPRVVR